MPETVSVKKQDKITKSKGHVVAKLALHYTLSRASSTTTYPHIICLKGKNDRAGQDR
jgi:hypothetical protein